MHSGNDVQRGSGRLGRNFQAPKVGCQWLTSADLNLSVSKVTCLSIHIIGGNGYIVCAVSVFVPLFIYKLWLPCKLSIVELSGNGEAPRDGSRHVTGSRLLVSTFSNSRRLVLKCGIRTDQSLEERDLGCFDLVDRHNRSVAHSYGPVSVSQKH